MRSCVVCIALAWAVGCGGSSGDAPAAGPVQGSITGRPFSAAGVVAATGVGTCDVPTFGTHRTVGLFLYFDQHRDAAFMSNPANACSPVRPHSESLNVAIWKYVAEGSEMTFSPGVYPIDEDHTGGVAGFVGRLDADCRPVLPNALVDSGTVRLSAIDGSRVQGELRFTFDDGSVVSGSFEAPFVPNVGVCWRLGVPGDSPPPPACAGEPVCSSAP